MAGTGDGVRTRLRILDASVEVLRAHGAAGYSVPKVAKVVGITQSTVTHDFPPGSSCSSRPPSTSPTAAIAVAAVTTEVMTAVHGHRELNDPAFVRARTAAIALLAPRLHAAHLAAPRRG
jgi:hypothetical protein